MLIKQLEAGGAAAELPEDASDRLEAYHDALEALAASSAAGQTLNQNIHMSCLHVKDSNEA